MESWNWIFGGSTGETDENKSTFVCFCAEEA